MGGPGTQARPPTPEEREQQRNVAQLQRRGLALAPEQEAFERTFREQGLLSEVQAREAAVLRFAEEQRRNFERLQLQQELGGQPGDISRFKLGLPREAPAPQFAALPAISAVHGLPLEDDIVAARGHAGLGFPQPVSNPFARTGTVERLGPDGQFQPVGGELTPFGSQGPSSLVGGPSEEIAAARGVDLSDVERIRGAIVLAGNQLQPGGIAGNFVSMATDAVLQGLVPIEQAGTYALMLSQGLIQPGQVPGQALPKSTLSGLAIGDQLTRTGPVTGFVPPGQGLTPFAGGGGVFAGGGGSGGLSLPGLPLSAVTPLAELSSAQFLAGGGSLTPTQALLIERQRAFQQALGESEINRIQREAEFGLDQELRPRLGFTGGGTATPIEDRRALIRSEALRQKADLNRALLAQSAQQGLQLPLQVQGLAEPARQFQQGLQQQVRQFNVGTRAGLLGAVPATSGTSFLPFGNVPQFAQTASQGAGRSTGIGSGLQGVGSLLQGIATIAQIPGLGQALGLCWIAAALYGEGSPRHLLARHWIGHAWRGPVATLMRIVYRLTGRCLAPLVHRSPWLQRRLRPWFDRAVAKAVEALWP